MFDTGKKKKACSSFCKRFGDVLKRGKNLTDLDKDFLNAWRSRAWLAFCMTTFTRITQITTATGGWFGEKIQCNEEITTQCYGEYNEALMDPLTPGMGYVLRILHIPSLIACIACYKWRWLADYFFLVIHLVQCVATVHLNSTGYNENYKDLTAIIMQHYIVYSMNTRRDVFICVISATFQLFVGLNVVYMKPLT